MSDATQRARELAVEKAKEVIAGCPEVWNRVCHIDQVTFEALEQRITTAILQQQAETWREAADRVKAAKAPEPGEWVEK